MKRPGHQVPESPRCPRSCSFPKRKDAGIVGPARRCCRQRNVKRCQFGGRLNRQSVHRVNRRWGGCQHLLILQTNADRQSDELAQSRAKTTSASRVAGAWTPKLDSSCVFACQFVAMLWVVGAHRLQARRPLNLGQIQAVRLAGGLGVPCFHGGEWLWPGHQLNATK